MSDKGDAVWVNDTCGRPQIKGLLEISTNEEGIFIGGDPDGLRSLAQVLIWLANIDQNARPMPDGACCHVHLHAKDAEGFNSLSPFSEETQLWRLDAKGTGELPPRYRKAGSSRPRGRKRGK